MQVPRLNEPPSDASSYIIPQLEGEAMTIPGSKGVFRMLASAKNTANGMAVFTSDAVLADAPGFHYHNTAHDIFMVVKGKQKLWAGDRCLIMEAGDFASVPPVCLCANRSLFPFINGGFVCRKSFTTHTASDHSHKPLDSSRQAIGSTSSAT